jgi:uncharacterized C2H2 Zn-finger protein
MATRDEQSSDVKCPKCGTAGVVHYSDNDYPFSKGVGRQIDSVVGEIAAQVIDRRSGEIEAACKRCGTKFKPW